MLSYKGDTLGEHMHAWPQDLTRAEGREEERRRGGEVIGYIDNKTNRSHLVSIGTSIQDPTMASNGCLILNRYPVSRIEIIQFVRRKSMKRSSHQSQFGISFFLLDCYFSLFSKLKFST